MGIAFNAFETALVLWMVILTLGLVVYLAYLQYRKMKRRRAHRRHRASRAIKQSGRSMGEHQTSHNHPS